MVVEEGKSQMQRTFDSFLASMVFLCACSPAQDSFFFHLFCHYCLASLHHLFHDGHSSSVSQFHHYWCLYVP